MAASHGAPIMAAVARRQATIGAGRAGRRLRRAIHPKDSLQASRLASSTPPGVGCTRGLARPPAHVLGARAHPHAGRRRVRPTCGRSSAVDRSSRVRGARLELDALERQAACLRREVVGAGCDASAVTIMTASPRWYSVRAVSRRGNRLGRITSRLSGRARRKTACHAFGSFPATGPPEHAGHPRTHAP